MDNIVVLNDNDGNELEFEYLDLIYNLLLYTILNYFLGLYLTAFALNLKYSFLHLFYL